jgi:hypothetical protein
MPNSTLKVKGEFWASPPHIRLVKENFKNFLVDNCKDLDDNY